MGKTEVKVTVLLEHHEGDQNWTAHVPLIPGALEEGSTPDEAAQNVIPVVKDLANDSLVLEDLKTQPEFQLREVTIQIPNGTDKLDA